MKWEEYISGLNPEEKERILFNLIDYMLQFGTDSGISFYTPDDSYEDERLEPHFYWSSCGENILDD
jgi:hypothetical protein